MDKLKIRSHSDSEREELQQLAKTGITYFVRGKEVPDSAIAQQISNELGISAEIVDYGSDHEKCWVHTRGITKHGQFLEDVMIYDWETLKEIIFIDFLNKALKDGSYNEIVEGHDKNNRPILKAKYRFRLWKDYISAKNFALRDMTSKSYRRVFLKLANKEWVEDEAEKGLEQIEKDLVQDSIKNFRTRTTKAYIKPNPNPKPKSVPNTNNHSSSSSTKPVPKDLVRDNIKNARYTNPKPVPNPELTPADTLYHDEDESQEDYLAYYELRTWLENQVDETNSFTQLDEFPQKLDEFNQRNLSAETFQFFIFEQKWQKLEFNHWDFGDQKQFRMLRIKREGSDPISIYFHKNEGNLSISNPTKFAYPSETLQSLLKKVGFIDNWVLAPEKLHESFKQQKTKYPI